MSPLITSSAPAGQLTASPMGPLAVSVRNRACHLPPSLSGPGPPPAGSADRVRRPRRGGASAPDRGPRRRPARPRHLIALTARVTIPLVLTWARREDAVGQGKRWA